MKWSTKEWHGCCSNASEHFRSSEGSASTNAAIAAVKVAIRLVFIISPFYHDEIWNNFGTGSRAKGVTSGMSGIQNQ
jgi:hypothetical protein